MRILIVSDAWFPQTNGVVSTLAQTSAWLLRSGHEVRILSPQEFRSVPCLTYKEIRLAVTSYGEVAARIDDFRPQAIHIATEGPLGFRARRYCLRNGLRFTTSVHTQFPQYLRARFPIPVRWTYQALRWFHAPASHCMVSTPTFQAELESHGFRNIVRWERGVDTQLFRPGDKSFLSLPRPIAAYVGRVAVEKNVGAFLRMPWQGSKLVIGDGPDRPALQARFPEAHFVGFRFREDLAAHIAAADVMVFPSRTDTFGLVNLEAMACGVPVAAYPVTGPIDVITNGVTGALDEDLGAAALRALLIDPRQCRARAERSGWDANTRQFEGNLVACRAPHASAEDSAKTASVRVTAPS